MAALGRFIACTLAISLLVWGGVLWLEQPSLPGLITLRPGTPMDLWVADFTIAAAVGIYISVGGALLWFATGKWFLPVKQWTDAGRRWIWGGIGLVAVFAATAYGFFYVVLPESGGMTAYVLFFLNSLLIYYLSTLLASPPSYKYTPFGASTLRKF